MRTTLRTTIALLASVAVLSISAVAASSTTAPALLDDPMAEGGAGATCPVGVAECDDTPDTPTDGVIDGGGMAMCVEGVPDCDDMIVDDGGIAPDCGETVEGEGPDGTVSYTPCENTDPPLPTEPVITEPTPGMANVYARGFDSATIGEDDVTVTIDFVSGIEPCYVLDHIDVDSSADAVTITLFEGSDLTDGQVACIEIGVFKRAVITLDGPLAGRTIEDGAK